MQLDTYVNFINEHFDTAEYSTQKSYLIRRTQIKKTTPLVQYQLFGKILIRQIIL